MFNSTIKQLAAGALVAASLYTAPTLAAPILQAAIQEQGATRISINAADAATLAEHLVGIGPAKADAIVAWRTANGRFTDAEQLLLIKGIGQATLDKNKTRITL